MIVLGTAMLQWAYFKDQFVVPPEKKKNLLHPYLYIAASSRELPLFPVLKINFWLKREKEKPLKLFKRWIIFVSNEYGRKKICESPAGLEPTTLHSHVVQMRYPWSRGTLVLSSAIFWVHMCL